MSFQTSKTFVHLWNTNEDIFDEIWELSDSLALDSNATIMFKTQKGSKDIAKIVHVTSVVQPYRFATILGWVINNWIFILGELSL